MLREYIVWAIVFLKKAGKNKKSKQLRVRFWVKYVG